MARQEPALFFEWRDWVCTGYSPRLAGRPGLGCSSTSCRSREGDVASPVRATFARPLQMARSGHAPFQTPSDVQGWGREREILGWWQP